MKLADVLNKECIAVNAAMNNKAEVLMEVAKLAGKSSVLKGIDEKKILAGLEARESLGSTGVGKGVAIPHCRLKSVTEFVVGIITIPSGVDFEALDGEKVRLVVFIIAPEAVSNKHVRLLSVISQKLLAPKVLESILAEQTPEGVYSVFLGGRDEEINGRERIAKSLINVFIQNEELFRDVLQVLAGVESCSLVVAGVENASVYLSRMPLFASFWSDEPTDFSRIIIAVVDKNLTNETLRRIESITGDLNKSIDIMVTVQEVSYAAGSLST
ncbi:MAG: PTS sugar transporter subunit IIA [Sedimentisphaerales bacterium]|nr:PTS sugar transporter subunit IIA [Sedimentisphaerales bacterium]